MNANQQNKMAEHKTEEENNKKVYIRCLHYWFLYPYQLYSYGDNF